ncbi:tetratricopeptide repeat protein [Desulfobulbus sp. F5]|nr:tetratricopeptide repeat protein [Desulfobulbus sp. F5]
MELLAQIKAALHWLPKNPDVIWSGWGLAVFSLCLTAVWFVCSKFYACLRKPKAASNPPDVGASQAGNVLTFEQYKKDLLELHEKYVLEKQKREDIERKLANPDESYQEKLRLLEESQEKLQQLAASQPKEQLAEAEKRLAQGDTELAELLFDRVAEETGQTAAAALLQSGRLAEDRLDYSKALRNYTAAVALAPDNPDYLLSAWQMAYQMGEYQQAEEWLEHLLAIWEQEGKEDAELALALNDLALVYMSQGRYEEAELRYKRSLEIWEEKLGKDHPDVAISLNNLASLYYSQGRYAEAEPLYKRALEIIKKVFVQDHPSVATYQNNLALLYDAQGRYAEAEPLYRRSLEICEKFLGKEHPHVAAALNNLAWLYYSQGRYAEAKPLYQRALAIFKAKFPNGHPNIDTAQANYNTLKEKMQAR